MRRMGLVSGTQNIISDPISSKGDGGFIGCPLYFCVSARYCHTQVVSGRHNASVSAVWLGSRLFVSRGRFWAPDGAYLPPTPLPSAAAPALTQRSHHVNDHRLLPPPSRQPPPSSLHPFCCLYPAQVNFTMKECGGIYPLNVWTQGPHKHKKRWIAKTHSHSADAHTRPTVDCTSYLCLDGTLGTPSGSTSGTITSSKSRGLVPGRLCSEILKRRIFQISESLMNEIQTHGILGVWLDSCQFV